MRRILTILTVLFSCSCNSASAETPKFSVHFSPHGGCSDAIVAFIGEAHDWIRLSAYGFTSVPIRTALAAARKRGVNVQLVLDRSDDGSKATRNSQTAHAHAAGIAVWIDAKHPIFHDKFVVVDGEAVETGSYNYTAAAENSNAENCLIVRDVGLAREYAADWEKHRKHARML